jgi:divalent metal cation (Fe/Co/Zn/Cd) transporter
LFTIIATGIGFGFWKKLGSALCLLYGLESLIDLLSSLAVLWRFFNAKNNDTEEHHAMLEHREIRASTAISFILILLGIMVMAAAAYDSDESYNFADDGGSELKVVIALSFSSILVFGTLTMYKFHYASKVGFVL